MLGFDLPPIVAASVSMAFYASAYLGEIWRGCIQAVPWQQWEASDGARPSPGRSNTATSSCRRRCASRSPPTVGFMVQLVKNTSIVSIIGLVELARAGRPGQQRHLPALHGLRHGGADLLRASAGRSRCWPGAWKGSSMPSRASRLKDVHKSFGAVEVLEGRRPERRARRGGGDHRPQRLRQEHRCCAASTGSSTIQSGRIEVAGHGLDAGARGLRDLRKDVGIVFQSYNLFPHLQGRARTSCWRRAW